MKYIYKLGSKLHLSLGFCSIVLAFALAGCGTGAKTMHDNVSAKPFGDRYVVVLSLDGFRYDYWKKAQTPTLDSLARHSTYGRLRPCFPSLTFPNHYAMATGLHPDHHGIVANEFWDPEHGHYRLGDRKAVENPAFYNGEPAWNTARRQGVNTASFFWVGSETPINGHHPHRWKKFNDKVPYMNRADSVISWLQLPEKERPHLIMWYIEEPDHTGHEQTPESPVTLAMVSHLDSILGAFLYKMNQLPIASKIDFLLVSDHGMATYTPDKSVNLADYVDRDQFDHVATGAFTHLYPKKDMAQDLYNKLQKVPHVRVFWKKDVPTYLHYGTNARIGDIVVIPNIGTMVYFAKNPNFKTGGAHGYDNKAPEMNAIFMANGPHFRSDSELSQPLLNLNVYGIICKLLNITPAPNDGDVSEVNKLIVPAHQK
ncbi:ectonucleotide pyrophosphatase/phosphodiesterase [Porphyromonas pogonae]|uniref:alkaline phosphatase family protein n=1 Tax=Porphyromonas pogonae TaxID=867595 RepID=UPI002E776E66|nr:ectonucleotide pyrophosphatase/phosphodiesterase [Porphyromonas pogonae]